MLSSEPIETTQMQNKISSMKHDKLEQLTAEDDVDASTKVSNTELVLDQKEEELTTEPTIQLIKTTKLIKEFESILTSTPEQIGETALKTWKELGPFKL